jgi:hypothetical protein
VVHGLRALLALLVVLAAGGCSGIELGVLATAALSAGAGSAVKAGTEYTLTGTAYRTFMLPLEDLAQVVRSTLAETHFQVDSAAPKGGDLVIEASGIHRTISLRLVAITPAVTSLKVLVKKGPVVRDRATASALVAQFERKAGLLNPTAELR